MVKRSLLPEGDGFEQFWDVYPRRVAKKDAQKAWKKVDGASHLHAILAALEWQCRQLSWLKDAGAYIPHPASYLNAARWTDEAPKPPHRPGRRDWWEECKQIHGATCENRYAHEMKARDE